MHLKRYSLSNVYKFIYIIILYVKVSKFNVEEMMIDLYYWFDKSTKGRLISNATVSFVIPVTEISSSMLVPDGLA